MTMRYCVIDLTSGPAARVLAVRLPTETAAAALRDDIKRITAAGHITLATHEDEDSDALAEYLGPESGPCTISARERIYRARPRGAFHIRHPLTVEADGS